MVVLMKKWLNNYLSIIVILCIYLAISSWLFFFPVAFFEDSSNVVNYYALIGINIDQGVARNLTIFVVAACFTHLIGVFIEGVSNGWPRFNEHDARTLIYCFFRAVFILCFCMFSLGAVGHNISNRNLPGYNSVFSELVGAFILSGWVWAVDDFIGAFYVYIKRKV